MTKTMQADGKTMHTLMIRPQVSPTTHGSAANATEHKRTLCKCQQMTSTLTARLQKRY